MLTFFILNDLLSAVMVVMSGHLVIQAWKLSALNLIHEWMVRPLFHLRSQPDHFLLAHNPNLLEQEDKEPCPKVLLQKQL